MKPEIALIVASARNGVIGRNNTLPWHCPSDLKHFKTLTMGKAMIMGRKTWDSIGKPLPGRVSIVLSSSWGADPRIHKSSLTVDPGVKHQDEEERVLWTSSIPQAITAAQTHPLVENHSEIMIIGGAQIYAAALPHATKIYRTLIDAEMEGDAFFPELGSEWKLLEESASVQSEKDEFQLIMQVWGK